MNNAAVETREPMKLQWIHLASDEWGSDLMDRIAKDYFDTYIGDKTRLVVEIHEHAGWFLAYGFIGGRVRTIGSANDSARFDEDVKAFWKKLEGGANAMIPSIRREPRS